MLNFLFLISVLVAILTIPVASAEPVLTNCALVARLARQPGVCGQLDIRATVVALEADDGIGFGLTVYDGTAGLAFEPTKKPSANLRRGDTLRLRGRLFRNEYDEALISLSNASDIVHGPAPEPVDVSALELKGGRFDNRLVRVTGIVRNIFPDDIDPRFQFMLLTTERHTVYVAIQASSSNRRRASELLGATVAVTGVCRQERQSSMRQPFRRIERQISPFPDGIRIVCPPQTDFVPDVATLVHCPPDEIPLNWRYRARGRILAVWHENEALLRHENGSVFRVKFVDKAPPRMGESVEVVGFPESNLFVYGLTGSIWKPAGPIDLPEPAVSNVTVRQLMENDAGKPMINVRFYGQPIRIEGRVLGVRDNERNRRIILAADGYLVPIDAGTNSDVLPEIPVGSRIAATGTCVMDIDDWRPNAPFPRVHGFSVVPRQPSDIKLLARPPWWTPSRLMTLIFSMLAVLLASAFLNIVLKRIIERRSRQLEDEIGARIASESKIGERTRLAVELHDAISQGLTGVALQLQTVRNCADALPPPASRHLDIAEQTLGSCRDELKNCLWDLRNNALECTDMNEAIRLTLAPHVGTAELTVRFNVARERFTDNFTHALLHILRELASNAIRHGHATQVKVAGCIDSGRLLFSVSDNGCGFDPERCLGFEEGHFGLLGIRERMDKFEGDLSIDSNARGTRVSASMAMTSETDFRKTP